MNVTVNLRVDDLEAVFHGRLHQFSDHGIARLKEEVFQEIVRLKLSIDVSENEQEENAGQVFQHGLKLIKIVESGLFVNW